MANGPQKQPTWYDAKITPAERLEAFNRLPQHARDELKKAGYQPGTVPTEEWTKSYEASLHEPSRKAVVAACRNAMLRRDPPSVRDILNSLINIEHFGRDEDRALVELAVRWIVLIVQELEHKAYVAFRESPTSDNFARCWGVRSMLSKLDIPKSKVYPESPWPLARAATKTGPYTVVRGDSLSKIALNFYGRANLWDAIYESNLGRVGDPDRIVPGTVLEILKMPPPESR